MSGAVATSARVLLQVRRDPRTIALLLLVPIVVPLIVPLYNAVDPTIGGWPRFYWLQLLYVALGVATTVLVYRMTRRSKTDQQAARDAIARDADTRNREG